MFMINIATKKTQLFVYFLSAISFVDTIRASSMSELTPFEEYFFRSEEDPSEPDWRKEDEQLIEEILDVVAELYKDLIDTSALYFSGIIVDERQMWDRIFMSLSRESLRVVKLLAQYGPKMLKNPKIPVREKIKKTAYIGSFLTALWVLVIYERSGQQR